MKSMSILAIFCYAIILAGCSSIGKEYYISQSGNDEATGTSPEKAWKSIDRVNKQMFKPGDKILFKGGEEFTGSLTFGLDDSGTPEEPVTAGSYGNGRATISSGSSHGLYAVNTSGMVVKDLVFKGAGVSIDEMFSGILFYTDLDTIKPGFISIDNVEVSGYRWEGIGIHGEHKGHCGYRNVRINNAVVHDNGDKGIAVGGPMPEGDWANKDIYIGNCTVYNIRGISGKKGHSGNGIIVSSLDGGVIEYCVAYNNGEFSDDPETGGPIGIWAWDSRNVVIQFCEAYENKTGNRADGGGFDLDGGCVDCIMQYNYSHDNHGAGYGIYQYSGAREFRGNIIRYNISENDGLNNRHGGINLWSTNSSGGMQDTKIYNNTIFISEVTHGAAIEDFPDEEGKCFVYGTEVYNNIFAGTKGKKLVHIPNPESGWTFKNNCYWNYDDKVVIDWDGKTYSGLDEWRNATGQEKMGDMNTGFMLNPDLTDPGNGGMAGDPHQPDLLKAYMLKLSSGLIDKGLDIKSVFGIDPGVCDFFGKPVPSGSAFDVGAIEFRNE